MSISLIGSVTSRSAVVQCLQAEAGFWSQMAASEDALAAQFASDPDISKSNQADADKDRRRAADIQGAVAKVPPSMGVAEAHKFLWDCNNIRPPDFDAIVVATLVKEGRTDADGKYVIDAVPEGDYFLHARLKAPSLYVEWLVAVHVAAGSTNKVDLFNENATILRN